MVKSDVGGLERTKKMGKYSEILDGLAKVSTSTILAIIIAGVLYLDWQSDERWNDRLLTAIERQAVAMEKLAKYIESR